MWENLKVNLIYLALGLLCGAFLYARFTPEPIPQKLDSKKDTVYVERIIKKKDGTVVVEKIERVKETIKIENPKHQYRVAILPTYNFLDAKVIYGASIERRIIGDLWMGVYGSTRGDIGLQVGLEF